MKFNFRKIASILTSAVMLSSTVAVASAADFAPFVNNGVGDYAVVYGSTAQAQDSIAAADINTFLNQKVTTTSAPVADVNDTITGENYLLQRSTSDKFNLGKNMSNMKPSGLTVEELPLILADGTYTNTAGNDFEYEQTIDVGDLPLGWYQSGTFNGKKPFIGFLETTSGTMVAKYTLEFSTDAEAGKDGANLVDLKNTVIQMMGRDYYISNAVVTSNGVKLTLLDTANSVRIAEGETQTITVGDQSYAIKVVSVYLDGSTNKATLEVNGVELSTDLAAGSTAKLPGTNTYVGVKRMSLSSRDSVASTATVTIGTGQLVLENGQEVQLNGKDLSALSQYEDWTLTATITNTTATDISKIILTWDTGADVALYAGQSWTMPGLESLKLTMTNFVVPTSEETEITEGDNTVEVSTTLKDGPISLNILGANSTTFNYLGYDATERLITADMEGDTSGASVEVALDKDTSDYVALTWINADSADTYVYQITGMTSSSGNNLTTLTNMADTAKTLEFAKPTSLKTVGDLEIEMTSASFSSKNATFKVTASTGSVYVDRIVTKEGLQMMLPATADLASSSFDITFNESDPSNGNIGEGTGFVVTVSPSSDGAEPSAITGVDMIPQESRSDIDVGYVVSDLATYLEWNNPSSGVADLLINYHNSESYAKVYVSEGTSSVSGGGVTSGSVIVTDTGVDAVKGKNLVVVGGSCVNTVAAKLIDSASTAPICGADWQSKTGVGAGSFLIQTFASPYTGGKVATLVAGYDAADTTSAASAFRTQTFERTAGSKYIGKPGQTLQLTTV